jgi:hypothetical protein
VNAYAVIPRCLGFYLIRSAVWISHVSFSYGRRIPLSEIVCFVLVSHGFTYSDSGYVVLALWVISLFVHCWLVGPSAWVFQSHSITSHHSSLSCLLFISRPILFCFPGFLHMYVCCISFCGSRTYVPHACCLGQSRESCIANYPS